eukprot:CAMPEP_0197186162 /NCGR_PEP_ID=MMETSP1423-20130617/13332_1 /TAXON_ID=476441 /ORGANISM="Pseudo-nitzschia heimii, Strain UNC1101" /LENGTH=1231 /DNA_ID=CAMNT_0042637391 /DNA_START=214 /DNA_END=3905 /DNA_ORIENTATION=+
MKNDDDEEDPAAATRATAGPRESSGESDDDDDDDLGADGGILIAERHNDAGCDDAIDVDIEREEQAARKRRNTKLPADSYSFMMLHGPFSEPRFFFFGFKVWLFQVTFQCLMVLRVISKYSTNEDTDNPSRDSSFNFIPSNVSGLSRITQFMALLSYCVFADDSLKDIVTAIEMFPRFDRAARDDMVHHMVFSCVLRFTQGVLATVCVLLLVIQTSDVIDIILNFAAVNFISGFDDVAFQLAQWGKYGPDFKAEADRIENATVPDCVYRKYDHVRYRYTISTVATSLILTLTTVAVLQQSSRFWVTGRMRVQFKDGSLFEDYSGCYDLDLDTAGFFYPRNNYDGVAGNEATFGYCDEARKWYLYKHGENRTAAFDACDAAEVIATSGKTYTYDIYSTFEETWYSTSGRPLELYFFDNQSSLTDDQCGSYLGDGICNSFFNRAEYDYDEGDCCAATCDETQCGIGALTNAFDTDIVSGNGYPMCIDKNMQPITIRINDVYVPEKASSITVLVGSQSKPREPIMTLDCNGKNVLTFSMNENMKNKTEVVKVADGANCTMMVTNSTFGRDGILFVDYTVFHGDEKSIVSKPIIMLNGDSAKEEMTYFQRIHECYFTKLQGHINFTTIYTDSKPSNKAVKWLTKDTGIFSDCESEGFLERYALATINYAAPILPRVVGENATIMYVKGLWITTARHCLWRAVGCTGNTVTELNYQALGNDVVVSGTLATEIALLKNLSEIAIEYNDLRGTIPSQIGQLSRLTYFGIQKNSFVGLIPTEIGALEKLKLLDLSENLLHGSIPSQLENLSSLEKFWMWANRVTGTIPSDLGKLTLLKALSLDVNLLTGTIPSTIGKLEKLYYIGFLYNFLTGTFPKELNQASLRDILLDYNQLTGSIPTEVLKQNADQIDVFSNMLSNLLPIDGSVICPNPNDPDLGEHYCNCGNHCFPHPLDPQNNKCDCDDGQSCCSSIFESYTECIICEHGIQNIIHFIPDLGENCEILDSQVRYRIMDYGTEESCNEIKAYALESGCRCNEEAVEFKCTLCDFGLENPELIIGSADQTCLHTKWVFQTNLDLYGVEIKCNVAKENVDREGCRCLSEEAYTQGVENIPWGLECIVCEFGLDNPDLLIDNDTTCNDFNIEIGQNMILYGQEDLCLDARKSMEEAGCVCKDAVVTTDILVEGQQQEGDFGLECIICSSGLQNPDLYLTEFQARCIDLTIFIRGNIEHYRTTSACDDA